MDLGTLLIVGAIIAYPFIVSLFRSLVSNALTKIHADRISVKYESVGGEIREIVFSPKNTNELSRALETIRQTNSRLKDTTTKIDSSQHGGDSKVD